MPYMARGGGSTARRAPLAAAASSSSPTTTTGRVERPHHREQVRRPHENDGLDLPGVRDFFRFECITAAVAGFTLTSFGDTTRLVTVLGVYCSWCRKLASSGEQSDGGSHGCHGNALDVFPASPARPTWECHAGDLRRESWPKSRHGSMDGWMDGGHACHGASMLLQRIQWGCPPPLTTTRRLSEYSSARAAAGLLPTHQLRCSMKTSFRLFYLVPTPSKLAFKSRLPKPM
ncbi:hypothetical protein OPV22_018737 [Ensete ventricosum]|uniref:Uncharacterized protein n=1 Tax=Ensete ventricosum TaxID=4639 RepID=A0AAV8R3Z8_ENSVE|nr:hypothetical protein OPV22_018737 [Ensete ventricosum]